MRSTYEGRCHCQNLHWKFHTEKPARDWLVRSCQCSFCRAHGARCTSDPDGAVDFSVQDESALLRYQFSLSVAQFLVCKNCGVYIGAIMTQPTASFTTINLNTMITTTSDLPEPNFVSYDNENLIERVERRQLRWTPVTTAL